MLQETVMSQSKSFVGVVVTVMCFGGERRSEEELITTDGISSCMDVECNIAYCSQSRERVAD